jgi:transcription termination/antitermination protein NusG
MLLNMADENKSGAPAEDEKLIETTETEEKIKEAILEDNLVDNASSEEDDENNLETQHFIKQEKTDEYHWYVIHVYSGYENKVMANILKSVENRGLQEIIVDVKVPMEETIEIKNGKKKHALKKMYPAYVMVKMILTDDSWYVVRNTTGVTGFVGPGSKPIPLTNKEVRAMGVEDVHVKLDVEIGDSIIVTAGPLESFVGHIEEIHPEKQKVKVTVSMFGRDTLVELDFVQIRRI